MPLSDHLSMPVSSNEENEMKTKFTKEENKNSSMSRDQLPAL